MLGRLLTGHIERGVRRRKLTQGLQEQRALTCPGVPANQDARTRHKATTQDPVELVKSGGQPG